MLAEEGARLLSSARSRTFVRNLAAGEALELFLVAAVSALLFVRFLLAMLGFPKVGGGGLHIAHMLWGGLLMLVALLLMMIYVGQRVIRLAAVVAGAGFGVFIDELGKFLTSDNNYFFRPTIALIYVVFIGLYLVMRLVTRERTWRDETYLMNALVLMQEAVVRDLDPSERARAMDLLGRVSPGQRQLGNSLGAVLQTIAPSAKPRQSFLERRFQQVRELGGRLLTSSWVIRVVVLYFAVRALSVLGGAALVAITAVGAGRVPPPYSLVTIAVAVLASCLGLIAVVTFARSRLTGLRWFLRSVLVSIFMVDALAFYEHALAALASLALDILLYAMLTALLRREGPGSSERRVAERVGFEPTMGQ